MWLVVSHDGDVEAAWVARGLRARTDHPVELLTASALVHDCRWEHRVGRWGASSRLVFGDGTVIDSAGVHGVVNRLCWLGAEGFAGASPRDRQYATAELYALGLSWLENLGPRVLNRPAGTGLAGPWRTDGQWLELARSVGLPIVPHHSDAVAAAPGDRGDRAVLLVDGQVIEERARQVPDLPPALSDLQRASELDVVEVWLAAGEEGGVALRAVSFLPALSRFGDPALDAVWQALVRRSGARG